MMATGGRFDREARRAALTASPLFQAMQPTELDEILKFSSERRFSRGATIFQQGDEGSSMMAVLVGRVRVSAVSGEGKEITLNTIGPGEVFGEIALLDGKPRSADVTAAEDTVLLVVERRHFIPFLRKNEDLFLRMLVVLCERLRRTSLDLEGLALLELPARLARHLLKLVDEHGRPCPDGGIRIAQKLSQGALGQQVGSARETVNKQLKSWERDGIVLREPSGHYIVRRPDELRDLVR